VEFNCLEKAASYLMLIEEIEHRLPGQKSKNLHTVNNSEEITLSSIDTSLKNVNFPTYSTPKACTPTCTSEH